MFRIVLYSLLLSILMADDRCSSEINDVFLSFYQTKCGSKCTNYKKYFHLLLFPS